MNRQSLVAKMLHLQVVSALVCILLYFALLFATRAGLSYYNNHSDIQQRSIVRQVERFQKYVTAQEISAKDTRAIDDWVGQQSFLLMNIYRGHRMLYSNFSFSFGLEMARMRNGNPVRAGRSFILSNSRMARPRYSCSAMWCSTGGSCSVNC